MQSNSISKNGGDKPFCFLPDLTIGPIYNGTTVDRFINTTAK